MPYKCKDCRKIVRTVQDIRNCTRCKTKGRVEAVTRRADDSSDLLTPFILGSILSDMHHTSSPSSPDPEPFSGGGGEFGGGGASGNWDSGSSSSDSSSSSSSSSDSSSSSSSDSGGGSSGGGSD